MSYDKKNNESVYSHRVKAGKRRTYFIDVRKTKGEDFYLTMTESTKRYDGRGYDRHKIFLYKEDFNRFLNGLTDVIDHVKTELMPDYDYDEFTRRHEENRLRWEAQEAQEANQTEGELVNAEVETPEMSTENSTPTEAEDDLSW